MNLRNLGGWVLAVGMLFVSGTNMSAQSGDETSGGPDAAGWYSTQHPEWPPLPGDWLSGAPYFLSLPTYWQPGNGNNLGTWLVDDRSVNYDAFSSAFATMGDPGPSSGPTGPTYGPTDLWLEITAVDNINNLAYLTLHGTTNTIIYELFGTTNVDAPFRTWRPLQTAQGNSNTNQTPLAPQATDGNPDMFFRAEAANILVDIIAASNTVVQANPSTGDPLQPGLFVFSLNTGPTQFPLAVYYSLSGTASNGVDYTDENGAPLSGVIAFAAGASFTNLTILPVPGRTYYNPLTLAITITPTNTYLIDPNASSATITITEHLLGPVAFLFGPVGLDYHAPSDSLLASFNFNAGYPNNFATIYTNVVLSNRVLVTNVVVTNWTDIALIEGEVELATAKQTLAGFTNGDMFFGNTGSDGWTHVGWVAPSGTNWDLNWAVLTNETFPLQGGLYVDRTGTFSNDLIAVSGAPNVVGGGNVWQISSNRQPRLLASFTNGGIEAVITLTNDPVKWGPWAGKIITGDEVNGIIYSVDTNGSVQQFFLGIDQPEDYEVIPANQDLYICDEAYQNGAIMKLPAAFFTNYVGQLLITREGGSPTAPGKLFIVGWDSATTNFVVNSITYIRPDGSGGLLEHAAFAPIDIPYIKQ